MEEGINPLSFDVQWRDLLKCLYNVKEQFVRRSVCVNQHIFCVILNICVRNKSYR
jgi:hypothetical protein